jgi:hypothetical protein
MPRAGHDQKSEGGEQCRNGLGPACALRQRGKGEAGGEAAERREPPAVDQGWSRLRRASIVAGPIPLIWSSCSIDATPPC